MMLPSRLGCPLSLKTPNMGNPGLEVSDAVRMSMHIFDALGIPLEFQFHGGE